MFNTFASFNVINMQVETRKVDKNIKGKSALDYDDVNRLSILCYSEEAPDGTDYRRTFRLIYIRSHGVF
ncbi:CLUMA_CG003589, isoform A [Clunio marinus]|uniref:CLUMA_CG003589, isoform A n=1 Tax=Clunio marinus TaxID=568069 RepID=A0A1J1HQY1_9DIPT|nr:CLUMA_CG003589, isoform A [Clunio marinus]